MALAHRGRLPLRMAEADLQRVPLTPLAPTNATIPEAESAPASPAAIPAPEAFRTLIDSLDLDGFGQPGRDSAN